MKMVCFPKNSAIFSPKDLDNSKYCINTHTHTHTHTHNSLVNNHLRGLNTICDFPAQAGESLFVFGMFNF